MRTESHFAALVDDTNGHDVARLSITEDCLAAGKHLTDALVPRLLAPARVVDARKDSLILYAFSLDL